MQKKLKYSFSFLSVVALATSLQANTLQKEFEKKHFTNDNSKKLFSHRVTGLNDEQIDQFILGKSFFRIPWVEAPSATTARDGLGPLFSANTCISCHPNNGISSIYTDNGDISRGYVSRLSIPSNGSIEHKNELTLKGFVSEPVYGTQLSINGSKNVPFEGKPKLTYKKITLTYPDGEKVELQKPIHGIDNQVKDLQYGKMDKNTIISNRIAQSLAGMGLLEKITDEQILANEDIDDSNNDGISGKANKVYSLEHKTYKLGRYTWKASAPSIIEQTANAAHNDMSLTSPFIEVENCTTFQEACNKAPKGDAIRAGTPHDLPQQRLEAIAFYLKNLKIPKSTVTEKKGEELFNTIGCAKCHIPSFTLSNGATIKPYTDLLLHDMGEGLSDGRSEFLASGSEWRTSPLWSIGKYEQALGKKPNLLHDGRARTIEEAILWHGGEAQKAQNSFMELSKENREKVIKFIKEL